MKSLKKFLFAVVGGLSVLAVPVHAETILKASSYLPAGNIITRILMDWASEVERASEGRVKIELLAKPVTAPADTFDAVRDGLADVSWTVDGLTPGRFVLSRMAELPNLGDSGTINSVAYQRTYDKFFTPANEHAGVKMLGVFTHGPGHIFNTKHPIEKLADAEGLKIRTAGGVMTDVAQTIGATPIVKPASEVFELLNAGIVDGVMFPVGSVVGFNIQDAIKYGTIVPGGMYNASFSLFMNQASFDALPPEDQQAIASVSGEAMSKRAGALLDEDDRIGIQAIKAKGAIALITASPEFLQELHSRTSEVDKKWIAEAATRNVDGAAALEFFRSQIKEAGGE